jgi:hypothetical protein
VALNEEVNAPSNRLGFWRVRVPAVIEVVVAMLLGALLSSTKLDYVRRGSECAASMCNSMSLSNLERSVRGLGVLKKYGGF